jgi:RNA-directed DNA polymerase
MKEPHNEGVAPHVGPESCGGRGDAMAEALTGGSAGRLSSSEITQIRVPTLWSVGEGNTRGAVMAPGPARPGGVVEPGMHGHSTHGNRETSQRSPVAPSPGHRGRPGKDQCRTPGLQAFEESDRVIVPQSRTNNGTAVPAEFGEGRARTERNGRDEAAPRTQSRTRASFGLPHVRRRAKADRQARFNNLFSHLTPELLRDSFYQLNRDASPGIDGVTWDAYASGMDLSIPDLHERLHSGRYRAQPVKRSYLRKEDGRLRPLGVTALEDKIVQQACVTLLNEVFEADFLGFSYGFRPGRSQHDALDALHVAIEQRKVNWILDADIQGYFDTIPFAQLEACLRRRITDPRLLRLIRKWLKTGWVEDGTRHTSDRGTPQGAVISPLLGNVYLHSVLDEWTQWWRTYQARGEVVIVRYADDFVVGFQYERDGRAFLRALVDRMRVFQLKLHPTKTRLIEFGRFAAADRQRRGQGKPATFDFLGFTHVCSVSRRGRFFLRRLTAAKRLRRKLQEVKKELWNRMHDSMGSVGQWLHSVIHGHGNYYGVPGNLPRVRQFYCAAIKLWLHVIRRRSQKGRAAWPWKRFLRLVERMIPRPQVAHPFPDARFAAKYSR